MRLRITLSVAIGLLAATASVSVRPGLVQQGWVEQVWADQTDPRLPKLFDHLLNAASNDDSVRLDGEIWEIWVDAKDPALNDLLDAGTTAMQAGDYPTALDAFNLVIAKKPDFAEGWNKRATLYYLMDEDEKSIADIDKTLALEPRHFGALSGLGLIHLRHERYEEAAKAYERVLAIDPMNAGAKHNVEVVNDLIKKKSI